MAEQLSLPQPSAMEARVWAILKSRKGKKSAIAVPVLARALMVSERELQEVVRSLILRWNKPIGSTSGTLHGWYVCACEEELLENYLQNLRRGLKILARAHAFKKNSLVAQILAQGEFLFEGTEARGQGSAE